MKRLVNDLFTSDEIMNGKHEETNERTEKIKGKSSAVQYLFHHASFILQKQSKLVIFTMIMIKLMGFGERRKNYQRQSTTWPFISKYTLVGFS